MKNNPLRSAIRAIGLAVAVIMLAGITRPHLLDDLLAARQIQQQVLFGAGTAPVEALVQEETSSPPLREPVRIAAALEQPLPLDLPTKQSRPVPDYHDPMLVDQVAPMLQTAERSRPINPLTLEARLQSLEIQVGSLMQTQLQPPAEELAVRIYRPRHRPAEELRPLILPVLTPGVGKLGLSKTLEPGGVISVRDRKPVLDRIGELLTELDLPRE